MMTRITRRSSLLDNKRAAEVLLAESEHTQFVGNTEWRIRRIGVHWKRAAFERLKIEARIREIKFWKLLPADSQLRQKVPDERVADARAIRKYRRDNEVFTSPVRRVVPLRPVHDDSAGGTSSE